MPLTFQATVGASAIPVATADANDAWNALGGIPYVVQNLGAVYIVLGGTFAATALGTANGIVASPGLPFSGVLPAGDVLYALAATGYADVRVQEAGSIL